jgi:hypothetical protein
MRFMRGGNQGPSLKVHCGQCLTSMTKQDSGGWPPGAACDSAKLPSKRKARLYVRMAVPIKPISTENKSQRIERIEPHGHFPRRPDYLSMRSIGSMRGDLFSIVGALAQGVSWRRHTCQATNCLPCAWALAQTDSMTFANECGLHDAIGGPQLRKTNPPNIARSRSRSQGIYFSNAF